MASAAGSYKIVPLAPEHYSAAAALMTEAFTSSEPITTASKVSAAAFKPFGSWAVEASDKRLSLAVLDGDELIGAALCDDLFDPDAEPFPSFPGCNHVFALLGALDEKFFETLTEDEKKPNRYYHIFMTAVHASHTGKGIRKALGRRMEEVAREAGFSYLVSESTNTITQAINTKAGFRTVVSMPFSDFEFAEDGKSPTRPFSAASPDALVKFLVKDLEK